VSALPTARLGDACTHGAQIITGSGSRSIDGRPAATLGDLIRCPQHGVNPLIAVQTQVITGNRPTAHTGAVAQCGAVVIGGSADTLTG
jgi:uncharacterized Zn-binding protein involved in type VI secretion